MASGGARNRSGPAPDPNSLKTQKKFVKGDTRFVDLPIEGRTGATPDWPLSVGADDLASDEWTLWETLWAKPQAVMWERLGLHLQVALYCRRFIEAAQPGASISATTPVLRMEGELGINLPGMTALGWRIRTNDLEAQREQHDSSAGAVDVEKLSPRERRLMIRAAADADVS